MPFGYGAWEHPSGELLAQAPEWIAEPAERDRRPATYRRLATGPDDLHRTGQAPLVKQSVSECVLEASSSMRAYREASIVTMDAGVMFC